MIFTQETNENHLSSNHDKRIQQSLRKQMQFGMNKDLECTKKEIRCNNIINQYKSD